MVALRVFFLENGRGRHLNSMRDKGVFTRYSVDLAVVGASTFQLQLLACEREGR